MPHPWETTWTVGDRLGRGGQGVTYTVTRNSDGVRGALKHLKNNRSSQARGRMRREVVALQTLAKETNSVPAVLDHNTGQFDDLSTELYVVMELVDGKSLNEHVDEVGPLDIDTAYAFTKAVSHTIATGHRLSILHRDLKPDNIMVRDAEANDLVVVDYGLSFNAASDDDDLTVTEETFRNRFLDLPETNTPDGDMRDRRSDVTALCAILYYCLTCKPVGQLQDASGRLPHLRDNSPLRSLYQDDTRFGILTAIFSRGFSADIQNRFQEITELEEQLAALRDATDVDESDPVAVADLYAVKIRGVDRKTQLAEFVKPAQELVNAVMAESARFKNQLKGFVISMHQGGFALQGLTPDGLDAVYKPNSKIEIRVNHYSYNRHRTYFVASSGEKCVLYSVSYEMNNNKVPDRDEILVEEVAWYEGDSSSIKDFAVEKHRHWIAAMVKELGELVLKAASE